MPSVLRLTGRLDVSSDALVQEINVAAADGAVMDAMQLLRLCGHVLVRSQFENALYKAACDPSPSSFRMMDVWLSGLLQRPDAARDAALVARLRVMTHGDAPKAALLARVAGLMGVGVARSGGLRDVFASAWRAISARRRRGRVFRSKPVAPEPAA